MKDHTMITRLLSWVITFCLILSTAVLSSSAVNEITELDNTYDVSYSETQEERCYAEGEVLIMLAETDETESLELYAVYSNDSASVNGCTQTAEAKDASFVSEPVGDVAEISDELSLGVNFSEMKLLNPSKNSENELYSLEETNNSIYLLELEDTTVEDALKILNSNPSIAVAEPNYLYEFDAVPNDPEYSAQYAIEAMNVDDAWDSTTGSSSVVVGVIDSGIDGTHPDLVDNLWVNPDYVEGIGCMACSRSYDIHGYNFTGVGSSNGGPCGGTPTDTLGHGTHVAGIIGAAGNNSEGVAGTNWDVSIAWLGCSAGGRSMSTSAAIEALSYANNHDIMIVNNSYGSTNYSSIFEQAILNYDGLFIAAAGNESSDNDESPKYPACYDCPNILSVAATCENGDIAEFSNTGDDSVHVAAPGDNIKSTYLNGTYAVMSGTSMAAPQVAGIAALIKANKSTFNPRQLRAAICGTVQQTGKTYNVMYDGGVVDANAAINVSASSLKRVSFDYNYTGSPNRLSMYVMSGQKALEPKLEPLRDGYVFNGWYTASTGGTLYNFDNAVTTATTIYAQWSPVVEGSYGDKFPDYKFRKEVLRLLKEKDSIVRSASTLVSVSDISSMSEFVSLDISYSSIRDASGLEYFTGLTSLDCSHNKIASIDLSGLTKLKTLDCSYNMLSEVDVSSQVGLEDLNCSGNSLSSVDLSMLTGLKTLDCGDNQLSALNISTLTQLQQVECYQNKLTALNVDTLTNLKTLDCEYNQITQLNIGNAVNLQTLSFSHNRVSSIDLTALTKLRYLYCAYNRLTNLTTGSSLIKLHCYNNILVKLDISDSTDLGELYCQYNKLSVINVSGLDQLFIFDVSHNDLCERDDVIGCEFWDVAEENDLVFYLNYEPQNTWSDNPFTDVTESDSCYKAVEYVYDHGFMGGTSSTKFSPAGTLNRGQLVTILYRMAGSPSVDGLTNPFTDVSGTSAYLNAIKWAYNNGNQVIMGGTSSTKFNPSGTVSREMAAVVFDRYATRLGISLAKIRDYVAFTDESDMSSWASSSILKLYEAGIINGASGYYYPSDEIERGEVALLVRRFEVIRLYM